MHVVLGFAMVVVALVGARRFDGMSFGSYGHAGTIFLVVLGPIGAAVMSFDFRSLWTAVRALVDSIVSRADRRRRQVLADCYEVGRALRAGRTLDASRVLSA